MAEEKNDEKKIIIDEDWKQRAQKDKEVMAAKEEEEQKKGSEGKHNREPLPEGDFTGLLNMLFTQALFSMGVIQVQGQEKREPDLMLAKYNIEILEMLEEKTKGNLSDDESKVLANTLNELRMAFVKIAEMAQNQKKDKQE